MLDPKTIRAHPEEMREAIRLRNVDPAKADLDRWLALDERRRALETELESVNQEKNKLARSGGDRETMRQRGQELRARGREIEDELGGINAEWQAILDWFPNWPAPNMPHGTGPEENVEECAWVPGSGYLGKDCLGLAEHSARCMPAHPIHADDPDFTPRSYVELGEALGIDTGQGGKVSGSRFAYLGGDIALLQIAIERLFEDKLLSAGYCPLIPPLLVRERALYGTSHFPEQRDQVYEIKTDNVEQDIPLFLVGSSEPSNFSYFADRVLELDDLPIKVFAATPCFRSEAGSWGKDVRGIKRVHQFDKIEMNSVCTPEQSHDIYQEFLGMNEWLLQTLEIPYHVIDKCTGDAGYLATHRQRDVEAWLSGAGEYMEVMTDTNTTDYQARRLNIRYRDEDRKLRFCHTVNDTGVAMGRMLIAIVDNYQQKDGAIKVPAALRAVVGKEYLTGK